MGWTARKAAALRASEALAGAGLARRAEAVAACARTLLFGVSEGARPRFAGARFCRARLCPMCAWRRALKVFGQTSDIMGEMGRRGKYAYVFLTLTVPSVPYGSLSDCLDSLMGAWGRMSRQLAFGRAVEGWYRGVEVTRNAEAGTWHPHIHCILAVGEGYFTDARRYISRAGWLAMWRRAARDAAITQVDVRRVKGDAAAAVAEAAKYASKDVGRLGGGDGPGPSELAELDRALSGRRLAAFGGAMGKIHRELGMDDPDEGDLSEAGAGEEAALVGEEMVMYVWGTGYKGPGYYLAGGGGGGPEENLESSGLDVVW